jgi:hypothetical protein
LQEHDKLCQSMNTVANLDDLHGFAINRWLSTQDEVNWVEFSLDGKKAHLHMKGAGFRKKAC